MAATPAAKAGACQGGWLAFFHGSRHWQRGGRGPPFKHREYSCGLPAGTRRNMPKEEIIRIEGEITEILPDGRFRVKLENEHEIIAYTAGKMRKNRIRSIVGDRVHVEMTPYDLDKGRIVFREKTAPMPMNQRRFFRR
jgi:translation initiation factor IF-1